VKVELRPPRRDDTAAIANAVNEFSRFAGIEETPTDVEAWLGTPSLDVERDARVALVDGEIVGYADVSDSSREGKFVWGDVRVDSAQPQASSALLDFVERRGRELAPQGMLKVWSPEKAAAWRGLLESRGYALHHYSIRMVADLEQEPPEPAWPEGISVRTFRRGEDERAVYEVHQETFSDQRDFAREPFEDWLHWSLQEPFDPDLWFLAIAGEEIAGISLGRPEWGGDSDLGWIGILGVRRLWRRRGLGLALLLHSFRELRARGRERVGLGVDADNPTGAVRLYERAGMKLERRNIWYEKAVS
jgi:mycothiol synthase